MKIGRIFRVLLKIFPERQNKIVNGPGRRKDIIAPYRLENMLPGHHLTFPVYQQLQQFEFFVGQFACRQHPGLHRS